MSSPENIPVTKSVPEQSDPIETPTTRRNAAAMLGVLGAAFLSGCASADHGGNKKTKESVKSLGQTLNQSDFYWFDDISDLISTAGTTSQLVAVVGCHTSLDDGGGGLFYWDDTSNEDEDLGTIFEVTGHGTGRWKRIYSGPFNVRWFGAQGDGTTVDDTAFQKAIAAIEIHTTDSREGRELWNCPDLMDTFSNPWRQGMRCRDGSKEEAQTAQDIHSGIQSGSGAAGRAIGPVVQRGREGFGYSVDQSSQLA